MLQCERCDRPEVVGLDLRRLLDSGEGLSGQSEGTLPAVAVGSQTGGDLDAEIQNAIGNGRMPLPRVLELLPARRIPSSHFLEERRL